MLIKKVFIDGLGCLKNFHIDFNEPHSEHGQHGTTTYTLIGKNGTGKSTFLEAILRIFAVFDSESVIRDAYFDFDIEYEYASKNIRITRGSNQYSVWQDGNLLTQNTSLGTAKKILNKTEGRIFPRRIISFYSGTYDKLSEIERKTFRIYKRNTLNAIHNYLGTKTEKYDVNDYTNPYFPIKKYSSISDTHTNAYLIALLFSNNINILKHIYINNTLEKSIEILLNLNQLYSFIKEHIFHVRAENIEHYTKEIKKIVFDIFNYIDSNIADILHENLFNFKVDIKEKDFLKIKDVLNEEDILNEFDIEKTINIEIIAKVKETQYIDATSTYNFFEKINTIFSAKTKMLFPVNNSKDLIYTHQLSEGQRQLIKLLGMAIVSKNEECLILIDEIDAHMNPQWKYNLRSMMQEFFAESRATQIIMATHDPLTINGVPKEEIRIFERIVEEEEQRIITHEPSESTEGMGIDAILQSEYYGLKNSYDKATADKYQDRQELYLKLINNTISSEEKKILRELSQELGRLPFASNTIDFIYDDFMQEFKKSEFFGKEYLTVEEVRARQLEVQSIIKKLFEEK